ncbi:hypothetical protein AHAS_Ahas14G0190800 [Arachis hypogaea]
MKWQCNCLSSVRLWQLPISFSDGGDDGRSVVMGFGGWIAGEVPTEEGGRAFAAMVIVNTVSVKLGKLSLGGAAPKSSSTIYIWLHDSLGFPITGGKAAKKTSASARGKGKPVVGGAGSSKASRSSNSSKVIELTGI